MNNIQFNYLYRDGGNYKKHHSIIFTNPANRHLTELLRLIQSKLIDNTWFYTDQWGLPDLRGPLSNYATDPTWHEFENITYTEKPTNTLLNLDRFVKTISKH